MKNEKLLTKKELAKLKTAANNSVDLAFTMIEKTMETAANELLAHYIDVAVDYQAPAPSAPPDITPPATTAEAKVYATVAPKTTGVLILALGHPYYGEMAANLAGSIRFTDKNIAIHLIHAGNALDHLTADKLRLFTSMSQAPAEAYTKRGKTAYFKAKTYMYELSPYDKTLFLDADMLWLSKKSCSVFLEELDGIAFTIQNRDAIELGDVKEIYAPTEKPPFYLWADINAIKTAYNLPAGKLYGLHSELVYFEKGEKAAELFESVKDIYENPKIEPRKFAGDMADELAFAIAMLKHNVAPHLTPYSPIYWWKLDGRNGVPHRIQNLSDRFVAYSVGGNVQPPVMANTYNLMAKAYMRAVGVSRVWTLKHKKQFIKERQAL